MQFEIKDIDNNSLSIETDEWDIAVNKFFELYPNTRIGVIKLITDNKPLCRTFRATTSAEVTEDEINSALALMSENIASSPIQDIPTNTVDETVKQLISGTKE